MSKTKLSSANAAFLAEIEDFLEETGMLHSVFGRAAVGDGNLIRRLLRGTSVTLSTVDRVRKFMAENRRKAPLARDRVAA
jgi:hypothetical protein